MKRDADSHDVACMKDLLEAGFEALPDKLTAVPPLLAVTVPPYATCADDDWVTFWLGKCIDADWGDEALFDFSCGVDPACANREDAKYRLHAYIEYRGEESVTATRNISAGHFVAWFTEDHSWFQANDSVVRLSTPRTFPYICFFVR